MEHPGAIQYNEKSIFPGKNLTTDDELRRFELIAHETAHMWFGDLVTMRWFDDVWTKEVFANFLASKMSREQFPKINHDLNFLKMYQAPALSTDRTEGTHPIQQQLGNLNQAGLLYGNIIYDKAPVMMRKLEELMGPDAFRNGLRKYLSKFSFANATWDDLIDILEQEKPLAGVKDFSEVWVKQKGMPVITTHISNGQLLICQHDPYNRKLYWKQKFCVGLLKNHTVTPVTTEDIQTTEVNMTDSNTAIPIDTAYHFVIPNYDGRGYGRFVLDISNQSNITDYTNLWRYLPDLQRYALLTTLYENYLMHRCDLAAFSRLVFSSLSSDCSNELIESALCDYSSLLLLDMPVDERHHAESMLYRIAKHHCHKSIRMKALRIISTQATSPEIVDSIYHIWKDRSDTLITERDYINAAYHLAIVLPQKWQEVLTEQRSRLVNPDKQRMFDFVSRACNPSVKVQQELFQSLLDKSNRTVEPWASSMLELLSCHEREPLNNEYIMPGLNALQEIQRTGDIFFPSDWLYALLSDHTSSEAKQIVNTWLQAHQDEPLPLKNKLLQIAYRLLNRTSTY
jgi:aminopeptidase N